MNKGSSPIISIIGAMIVALMLMTLLGLAFGVAAVTWRWAWGIL